MNELSLSAAATLLLGASTDALAAEVAVPTSPPPAFFAGCADIFPYRAAGGYSKPNFVRAFVEEGALPPVAKRLPNEPPVYSAASMPDGVGFARTT